jgi:uncharacterized protein YaaQ
LKLVIAIVHDEDAGLLVDKLNEDQFRVTKLASTGGFLKSGNTTLLIGVEKEKVDSVLESIKSVCKTRQEITPTSTLVGGAGGYMSMPIEVTVGGATVFVVDVEQYMKV